MILISMARSTGLEMPYEVDTIRDDDSFLVARTGAMKSFTCSAVKSICMVCIDGLDTSTPFGPMDLNLLGVLLRRISPN